MKATKDIPICFLTPDNFSHKAGDGDGRRANASIDRKEWKCGKDRTDFKRGKSMRFRIF